METKTSKAITLFKGGRYKEALSIFATFRIGFTQSERRTLQIAAESLKGSDTFYQQLGIDTDKEIEMAKEIINQKYS